jgi:putative flavoprotein involved in K+ transport
MPAFPGAEQFRGQQVHSSAFTDGAPWRGKRCVVIGSNNSAHDICAEPVGERRRRDDGAALATLVARSETLMTMGWGRLFSEEALRRASPPNGRPAAGLQPYRLLTAAHQRSTSRWRSAMPTSTTGCARPASSCTSARTAPACSEVPAPRLGLLHRRRRLRADHPTAACGCAAACRSSGSTEDGVTLSDGSELPADLIVYATGYGSMRAGSPHHLAGVADKVGKVWGLGSDTPKDPGPWEGELRNMWKPTPQPGLWIHGGNLQQSRSYSLYLALQIKARRESLPVRVWNP